MNRHRLFYSALENWDESVPGSEELFGWLDLFRRRGNAEEVPQRALVWMGVALSAAEMDEARLAAARAEEAGLKPAVWAPLAILHGNRWALKVLQERGIDVGRVTHMGRSALSWVASENRFEALAVLLESGVSPSEEVEAPSDADETWNGRRTRPWIAEALENRAYGAARVLLKAGAFHGERRQDNLDRALLAVALSGGPSRGSLSTNPSPDNERWAWWKRLVKLGANPLRVWTHREERDVRCLGVDEKWVRSCCPSEHASALVATARPAQQPAGQRLRGVADWLWAERAFTPVHRVLAQAAGLAPYNNPDWHVTWEALDATVSWQDVPPDGFGLSLRGCAAAFWGAGASEVDAFLQKRGVPADTRWSLPALMLARNDRVNDKDAFWRDRAWEDWQKWMKQEAAQGRDAALPLYAACSMLLRAVGLPPAEAPSRVGELSGRIASWLDPQDRLAWDDRVKDVTESLDRLKALDGQRRFDDPERKALEQQVRLLAINLAPKNEGALRRPRL